MSDQVAFELFMNKPGKIKVLDKTLSEITDKNYNFGGLKIAALIVTGFVLGYYFRR